MLDALTEPGWSAAGARAEAGTTEAETGAASAAAAATDPVDRESYRRDETASLSTGLPLAVALPANTAEVSGLVRLAAQHRIPIVPRGAGSGLSGGAAGIEGALTIAMTRMNAILEID